MSLIFVDGFDHYDEIRSKWSVGSPSTAPAFILGRFGGQAVRLQFQNATNDTTRSFPQESEIVAGVAVYTADNFFPNAEVLTFRDSAGVIILELSLAGIGGAPQTQGRFAISKPGGFIDTPSINSFPLLDFQEWHYIQVKYNPRKTGGVIEITDGTGSVLFRLDGRTTEKDDNDVAAISIFSATTNNGQYALDDLYVLSTSGATNNDYLGDTRISTMRVDTEISSDFTGGIANIQEVLLDTAEINAGVIGAFADYEMTDPCVDGRTLTAAVKGVQIVTSSAKDNSGTIKYQQVVNSTSDGAEITPNTFDVAQANSGFGCDIVAFDVDPVDSVAWTATKIDNLKVGFRITTREGGA